MNYMRGYCADFSRPIESSLKLRGAQSAGIYQRTFKANLQLDLSIGTMIVFRLALRQLVDERLHHIGRDANVSLDQWACVKRRFSRV
jgi:hypothetical protein